MANKRNGSVGSVGVNSQTGEATYQYPRGKGMYKTSVSEKHDKANELFGKSQTYSHEDPRVQASVRSSFHRKGEAENAKASLQLAARSIRQGKPDDAIRSIGFANRSINKMAGFNQKKQ